MSSIAIPFPSFTPTRPVTKTQRRGFGLLEVILVFAIVIGAAAAVFTVFGYAKGSSDAQAITEETNLVAANLRASPWGIQHDFSTIPGVYSDTWMPGLYPPSWNVSGQAIEPLTGNAVWIGPGYTANQFSITLNYIPQTAAECQKLGSALGAAGYDNVLFAGASDTAVGGTIYQTTGGPQDPPTTHIVDQATLASYCAGTGGDPGEAGPTPGQSGFTVVGH